MTEVRRPAMTDSDTYLVRRFCFDESAPEHNEVIVRGLTLEQAREHCNNDETSSETATSEVAVERTRRIGRWFDGYEKE